MNKTFTEYETYMKKIGDRLSLYRAVAQKYNIKSAIYPGSHIDITPSLVIPKLTYIDNFKGAIKFFKDMDTILDYIELNKEYATPCTVNFMGKDYTGELEIEEADLIISQYAGFAGKHTHQFLKTGGILLCNDSHGDATLANFNSTLELVGVINRGSTITTRNLNEYFKRPSNRAVDLNAVEEKMTGPKYQKQAENYIFRKVQ